MECFQDRQAQHDLAAVAAQLGPAMEAVSRGQLERMAAAPEEGVEACLAATALLLLRALKEGDPSQDVLWHWEVAGDHARSASPPVRAALMRGFERCRQQGLAADEVAPSRADFISWSREQVASDLVPLAKAMTAAEREAISRRDYGDDVERHRAALEATLAHPGCRFPDNDVWFPAEPVELTAYAPSALGFVPATALVMIDCLWEEDQRGYMEGRWMDNAETYIALPDPARSALLKGFRHLFETLEHWAPGDLSGTPSHQDRTVPTIPLIPA